jgi:hypothetical protein
VGDGLETLGPISASCGQGALRKGACYVRNWKEPGLRIAKLGKENSTATWALF